MYVFFHEFNRMSANLICFDYFNSVGCEEESFSCGSSSNSSKNLFRMLQDSIARCQKNFRSGPFSLVLFPTREEGCIGRRFPCTICHKKCKKKQQIKKGAEKHKELLGEIKHDRARQPKKLHPSSIHPSINTRYVFWNQSKAKR